MFPKKLNRLGNIAVRTKHAGYSFASKLEADLFDQLKLMEKCGEAFDVKNQVHLKLTRARIVYIVDFTAVMKDGQMRCFEAKGFETEVWAIKRRLYKIYGPAPLEVWKKNSRGLFMSELIIPEDWKTSSQAQGSKE